MTRFVVRHVLLVFVLVCAIGSCDSLMALSLYSGGNTFNITVRNERFQSIYNARGSVYISGNMARIEVRADGYKTGRMNIYLRENNHYYSDRISLSNPRVSVKIVDTSGAYISQATLREISAMSSDYYAFEVTIPSENYSQFNENDIDIDASGSFVYGEYIDVMDLGSVRKLRVNIRRRSLNGDFSNYLTVTIPVDEEIQSYRKVLVKKLNYLLIDEKGENTLADEDKERIKARISNLR